MQRAWDRLPTVRRHNIGFLCSDIGPLVVSLLLSIQTRFTTLGEEFERIWCSLIHAAHASEPPDELLYGRAGYLYALLVLRKTVLDCPNMSERLRQLDDACKHVCSVILRHGRQEATATGFLMWSWHGKSYLGAAHGVCGILALLSQAKEFLNERDAEDIVRTIDFVVDSWVQPDGYFPSSLPIEYVFLRLSFILVSLNELAE